MPSLKDIRKRIASVKNTQKITKAMKLVSAAKLRRAQEAMNELRPYANKHRELLTALSAQVQGDAGGAPHPLLARRDSVKRVGVLAMSSDRGMCGGFNSSAQKRLVGFLREQPEGREVVIYPLGRRIAQFSRKAGYTIGEEMGAIIESGNPEAVRVVVDRLVGLFLSGELDEVWILSNEFKSAIAQIASSRILLPISPPASPAVEGDGVVTAEDSGSADLLYEPDQAGLLAYIVPKYVGVVVHSAILQSIAGEHAARMNAMNNATDNASDMIDALTLVANRARQAAITKELMEIIGGAEALK